MSDKTLAAVRTATEQTLDAHKRMSDWQLEQMKSATDQLSTNLAQGRSAMAAAVDMQQKMARAWLDSVAPTDGTK